MLGWSCMRRELLTTKLERDTCDCRKRKKASSSHLVKTRTASVVGRTHGCARTVAMSRRKRLVAQNIADVPLLFAVMVRRRTFSQQDPSIEFLTLGLLVISPTKSGGSLVSRADAKSGAFVPFVDEIDFSKIALSCHFALDLLCHKCSRICMMLHRTQLPMECITSFCF